MQCISASGGPGWYGRYAMLMNTTYPTAPGSFVFNVDFFEDAQCGGFNCTFKGSNCGVLKKDAGRCQGDHGFNYLANPPGQTHVVNITDICGAGVWGIQCQYYYTPFKPQPIEIVDGATNKCGGKAFQMKTVLMKAAPVRWTQAKFVWQEETNNSGIWVTIPGQVDSILTVTPPSFTTGFIKKKYRAYSVMNGMQSIDPSDPSQEITIWPTAPNIDNINSYRTITNVKCNGEFTGSVTVNRVDGIGNYKYSIRKTGGGGAPYGRTLTGAYPTFTNMPMGFYQLVVENNIDSINCYDFIEFWITEPPKLVVANVTSPQYNGYNISCKGGNNGSVNITGSGGTMPYSFTISKGAFTMSNGTGAFSNLEAGSYNFTIRDQNNCSVTNTFNLTEPALPLSASIFGTDIRCNGNNDGKINFVVSGGVPVYGYSINNGTMFYPGPAFNNLVPGEYICIARDTNNCRIKDTITLIEPTDLTIASDSIHHVSCFSGGDGYIDVIGAGGKGTYTYSFNNGTYQSNPYFSFLPEGNHKVKIKDGNNCLDSVNVLVSQPDQLNIAFTIEQVQCTGFDNGTVKAYVTGGIKPYQYTWTGFSDTDSTIENLSPGNYFLSVKDDHNCPVSKTANVTEPSDELTATISKSIDAKCNIVCNGEAEVTVTGGTPPYSYKWNNDNSLTTSLITNLCKGEYKVKILDSRNCTASIETAISDSVQFNINIADSTILCPGKSLFVDAENPGSAYEWYKSGSLISTSQSLSLNEDGSYLLKVTKPDGCFTQRNFKLRTSNEALQANFILPSFVALGDTVVFVEISQPLPDSINWIFEGSPQIINGNPESPVLLFENDGRYTIKLTAYLGECIDSLSKNITFFIPPVDTSSSGTVSLGLNKIRVIKLYPNPNFGEFKIEIELDIIQDLDVRIFNSQGLPITNRIDSNSDKYLMDFNLPLGNGVYLVKVQTDTDYKTITFIVN
ncbi:MAG: T9SS type A sorting domain-containing protein [Cytophagaceae bacterium]|nr:T9SS type A sorting domain-containing protein [Cytophagaceae bacterium]